MKKFHVIVDGCTELAKFIVAIAVEHGWDGLSDCSMEQEYTYGLFFNPSSMDVTWDRKEYTVNNTDSDLMTMSEAIAVIKACKDKVTRIELNDEYDAVYIEGEDFVRVGCQKFSKDAMKNLYNGVFEEDKEEEKGFHVVYNTVNDSVTITSESGCVYPVKYNHNVSDCAMKVISTQVSKLLGCELKVV